MINIHSLFNMTSSDTLEGKGYSFKGLLLESETISGVGGALHCYQITIIHTSTKESCKWDTKIYLPNAAVGAKTARLLFPHQ